MPAGRYALHPGCSDRRQQEGGPSNGEIEPDAGRSGETGYRINLPGVGGRGEGL